MSALRFLNVHYFAAGATLFGTEAKGAYEYNGKTYYFCCAGCLAQFEAQVQAQGEAVE